MGQDTKATGKRMYNTTKDTETGEKDIISSKKERRTDGGLKDRPDLENTDSKSVEESHLPTGREVEDGDAGRAESQHVEAPIESAASTLGPPSKAWESTSTGTDEERHPQEGHGIHQYPDGTLAEGKIEAFHPDLYEFMAPWSPWGRAMDPATGHHVKRVAPVEEAKPKPNWQDFEDGSTHDDWPTGHKEEEAVTKQDMELVRAMRDLENPKQTYKHWEEYVASLTDHDTQLELLNRTIHILGLGTAGKYIAHSIAALPRAPPVTLLMHRPLMMQNWHDEGAAIHVIKGDKLETQTNFHIESSAEFKRVDARQRFAGFGPNAEHTAEPPAYPIDTVIVTTPTDRTVKALHTIKDRLRHQSTIFFVNDGLGLAELVNEKVFPDPYKRPTYILGNMTHKLESTERHFTIIEKSSGRLQCSKLPQEFITPLGAIAGAKLIRKDMSWSAGASHLVGTLARTPCLNTLTLGHKSFYASQLQKLVANAVIGPLSVVYDTTNDYLLYNYDASQTMRFLVHEMSHLICSFPELRGLSHLQTEFNTKKLEAIIVSKIKESGKNLSKMLQDVRAGNRTDITFYNGYLKRRAYELGIDAPRNEMMLHLVSGKRAAKSREVNNYIPFENDY
ncbi:hypothetical protein LZ554_005531 [Drepanopeziza brunnea f. sp. 'monogermtubi']|nr:hypothetical protein LZ554_005531 [Drepanopeziza brunnea f. sp. 'monogermtubi']